jgi:hypothetical protein
MAEAPGEESHPPLPISLPVIPVLPAIRSFRGHTVKRADFRCFSPTRTIGLSRRPAKTPDETPGCCEYETVSPLRSPRRDKTIGMARHLSDRTVTSDAETPNVRLYPDI